MVPLDLFGDLALGLAAAHVELVHRGLSQNEKKHTCILVTKSTMFGVCKIRAKFPPKSTPKKIDLTPEKDSQPLTFLIQIFICRLIFRHVMFRSIFVGE
jgi:hypothetical protein